MNFIKSILRNLINVIFVKLNVNRGNVNLNDVSGALHKAWAHIFNNNLHGFYIEFGVYKGNSAIKSLENFNQLKTWSNQQKVSTEVWRRDIALSSPLNQEINFHFLDTFDGMPINKEKNKTFAEGTVHNGTISDSNDKGSTIIFNDDVTAFVPSRHLLKEDGIKLKKGDSAEFKVIEYNKDFKRVVMSHTVLFKEDEVRHVKESLKKVNKKKDSDKSTLGDLDVLADLKKKMDNKK